MSFLQIEAVSKRFGAVPALDDVSLTIGAASRTAIVGPSGSGKSTLLRLVAGFEAPDAGRIRLEGETLAEDGRIVPPHLRSIGLVSQDGALFPHLDVAANIGFGMERRAPGRRERILDLLDRVELDQAMAGRRPHELSGGQQQRVALARALARRPKLMLFDEPFSALDTGLRESMRRMVVEVLSREGVAAILVTHDQSEALSFADQVAILRDGQLVQAGTPRALYFEPRDAETAAFLGDAIVLTAELRGGWADCALGRVATAPGEVESLDGPARILIRPEQLRLSSGREDASGEAVRGEVVHVEFGGAACRLRLALPARDAAPFGASDRAGPERDIWVSVPSYPVPSVGDRVLIRIEGAARVLPGSA